MESLDSFRAEMHTRLDQTAKDEDVKCLRVDVDSLKGDVDSLKGDVNSLKGDVNSLRNTTEVIVKQIADLRNEVNQKDPRFYPRS